MFCFDFLFISLLAVIRLEDVLIIKLHVFRNPGIAKVEVGGVIETIIQVNTILSILLGDSN